MMLLNLYNRRSASARADADGSTIPSRGSTFSRTINEYVLYVIRDGNMHLREDGSLYHLKAGAIFFC